MRHAFLVLPSEIDRAATILAEAFLDDPVLRWLLAASPDRRRTLQAFFAVTVDNALRRGHCYRSAGWEAVAYWTPPGTTNMFDAEHAIQVGELIANDVGDDVPAARGELGEMMRAHHIEEPHFYLPFVGVLPDHQGRGKGIEVLRPVLDLCDRNGLPAYLEASSLRSVPFYRRAGFEVLAEFAPTGGPTLTGMRRPPTTAT